MPTLDIYVTRRCENCAEARRLAARLPQFAPETTVNLFDLDAPGAVRPPQEFATPTYMLDGRVISLGNPTLPALARLVCPTPVEPQRQP